MYRKANTRVPTASGIVIGAPISNPKQSIDRKKKKPNTSHSLLSFRAYFQGQAQSHHATAHWSFCYWIRPIIHRNPDESFDGLEIERFDYSKYIAMLLVLSTYIDINVHIKHTVKINDIFFVRVEEK